MSAPSDPLESLQSQVDGLNRYITLGRQLAMKSLVQELTGHRSEANDAAFRYRTLGQETEARGAEAVSAYLLSLVSSLKSRLGAE